MTIYVTDYTQTEFKKIYSELYSEFYLIDVSEIIEKKYLYQSKYNTFNSMLLFIEIKKHFLYAYEQNLDVIYFVEKIDLHITTELEKFIDEYLNSDVVDVRPLSKQSLNDLVKKQIIEDVNY